MRVAVWYNLPSGGAKRALYDHTKGLVGLGHSVEVWCPSTADAEFLPLRDMVPEHVLPLEWPTVPDRGWSWSFLRPYRSILKRLEVMREHCRACAEQINNGGFDVLIAHACREFAASPIGRYVRMPRMLYLQEPKRNLYEAMPTLPWQALGKARAGRFSLSEIRRRSKDASLVQGFRVQVREERGNAAAFQMILVNSLFSRESILRAYGLDAKVCYLGVDLSIFHDLALPRQELLLGIGAIHWGKNIEFVIRSVALLPQPRPSLVWVGNRASDKTLAQLRGLADSLKVEFVPKVLVGDEELVKLLNTAKAVLCAPRLEPFGYAPLEASACGTPVIAVAEGGVRETVVDGKSGILVEGSPKAMADAIFLLLSRPELARKLGDEGKKWVTEKWSTEAATDRLLARIAEIVPEGGAS